MTLVEQIQKTLLNLPPEKQREVLDFINFLQMREQSIQTTTPERCLREHPAFGSWKDRKIDALSYEQTLRAEWDAHR